MCSELQKDFEGLFKYALERANSFDRVTNGPSSRQSNASNDSSDNRSGNADKNPTSISNTGTQSSKLKTKMQILRRFTKCKEKGLQRRVKDCPDATDK